MFQSCCNLFTRGYYKEGSFETAMQELLFYLLSFVKKEIKKKRKRIIKKKNLK